MNIVGYCSSNNTGNNSAQSESCKAMHEPRMSHA